MRKASLHITGYCLTALMLLKMLGMPLVSLSFQMNRDFIAGQLCENRFKPQLQCNGHCVLAKKLAEANDNTPATESKVEVKSVAIDFLEDIPAVEIAALADADRRYSSFQLPRFTIAYIPAVFHPPAVTG